MKRLINTMKRQSIFVLPSRLFLMFIWFIILFFFFLLPFREERHLKGKGSFTCNKSPTPSCPANILPGGRLAEPGQRPQVFLYKANHLSST